MNLNNLMKQAQAMQKKMQEEQEKLALKEFEGIAGGEMVKITINGKNEIKSVKINPSIVNADEVDMLEDLIVAAYSDARKKLSEETEGSMSDMLGGMQMPPGFKLPF